MRVFIRRGLPECQVGRHVEHAHTPHSHPLDPDSHAGNDSSAKQADAKRLRVIPVRFDDSSIFQCAFVTNENNCVEMSISASAGIDVLDTQAVFQGEYRSSKNFYTINFYREWFILLHTQLWIAYRTEELGLAHV